MRPLVARSILAIAATVSPDPFARLVGHLQLIGAAREPLVEPWWRWTVWMGYGVFVRIAIP